MPTLERVLRLRIDATKAREGSNEAARAIEQIDTKAKTADTSLKGMDKSLDGAGKAAATTGKSVRTASTDVDRLDKATRRAGGGADVMKRAVAGLTAGLTATLVVRQTIATFEKFESVMLTVQGVTRASQNDLERLSQTARDLGASTKFSASEAGEGLLFLARAGFNVDEAITALPATLNLAIAGAIGLGEAADFASNILSQFRLEAEDTARVVDTLIAVSNRSNTDIRQLAEAMKFAGPVAGALGIQVEEAAAAIGILGDAGIQGSLAGTNLRGILSALLSPTKEAERAILGLGLTVEALNPQTQSLVDIFQLLSDAQLDATTSLDIFDRRNAAAALQLTQSASHLEELRKQTEDATTEAARMAEVMSQGLGGAFKSLRSAVEELMLRVGSSGLGSVLNSSVRLATDVVRALSGMESGISSNAYAVNILATAIKGLAISATVALVVRLTLSIRSLTLAWGALTTAISTSPLGALSLAIGAVVASVYLLIDYFYQADTAAKQWADTNKTLLSSLEDLDVVEKRIARERADNDAKGQLAAEEERLAILRAQLRVLEQQEAAGTYTIPIKETSRSSNGFSYGPLESSVPESGQAVVDIIKRFSLEGDDVGGALNTYNKQDRRLNPNARTTTTEVDTSDVIERARMRVEAMQAAVDKSRESIIAQANAGIDASQALKLYEQQIKSLEKQNNLAKAAIEGIATSSETEATRHEQVISKVKELAAARGLDATQTQEWVNKAEQALASLKETETTLADVRSANEAATAAKAADAEAIVASKRALDEQLASLQFQLDTLNAISDSTAKSAAEYEVMRQASMASKNATDEQAASINAQAKAIIALMKLVNQRIAQAAEEAAAEDKAANSRRRANETLQESISQLERRLQIEKAPAAERNLLDAELRARELAREAGMSAADTEAAVNRVRELTAAIDQLTTARREDANIAKQSATDAKRDQKALNSDIEDSRRTGESFGRSLSGAFYDIGAGADDAGAAIARLGERLAQMIYEITVGKQLAEGFGNLGTSLGTAFGNIFGGSSPTTGNTGTPQAIDYSITSGANIRQIADGAAFDKGIKAFAGGGVFDSPTNFSYGGGKPGLLGEAGPEAVLPLARIGGSLGVRAEVSIDGAIDRMSQAMLSQSSTRNSGDGGNDGGIDVTIINRTDSSVSASEQTSGDGKRQLLIEIEKHIAGSISNRGTVGLAVEKSYGVKRPGTRS